MQSAVKAPFAPDAKLSAWGSVHILVKHYVDLMFLFRRDRNINTVILWVSMWLTRLKIKHDCTIGNRCERFGCTAYSLPLGNWHEKSREYTIERHIIEGDEKNTKAFLDDLKSDKRIKNLEVSKNTIFFVGIRQREKIPTSYWNPRMFFVKPVFVDSKGYEYWEIASWKKETLTKFIKEIEANKEIQLEIVKIHEANLEDIYFPKLMPKLSKKQKHAFELAVKYGYYKFPRGIGLEGLAKLMKVSVSTLQEHLRKAEEKIIPSFGS